MLQASRIGSTRPHAASTLSARSNSVASPRMQSLISVAYASSRLPAERGAIIEIHGHGADVHLPARRLRSERKRNAFVGLDIQHQEVGLQLLAAEDEMRRAAELNGDFGDCARQSFPGTQDRTARRSSASCRRRVSGPRTSRSRSPASRRALRDSRATGLPSTSPRPYCPRTTSFQMVSRVKGRIDCSTLIFSLRTAVASKAEGGSSATSEVSCSTWL